MNWTEAQKTCQSYSANLISVRNQEENVYIQHRLNGARGWIGLNDRGTEGTFVWADNQTNNFTYWAKNQPNNFNNEDCVHTLGVKHSFKWNDVSCRSCHNYTCSEGMQKPQQCSCKVVCFPSPFVCLLFKSYWFPFRYLRLRMACSCPSINTFKRFLLIHCLEQSLHSRFPYIIRLLT